jgi:hypothetical protein
VHKNRKRLAQQLSALAPGEFMVNADSGINRVALLFLTKGEMPHEQTWKAWFDVAGYLLPRNLVLEACSQGYSSIQDVVAVCSALDRSSLNDKIDAQMLYSVYVHAPPAFQGYHSESLWASYRISKQIPTNWGDHSITLATKALLRAAVANPLNQRFVLISESDIPLYDSLTFYMQLMSEEKSRVHACSQGGTDMPYRWSERMKTGHMNSSHWRKSSQWFALQRKHAEIIVNDDEIERSFAEHCNMKFDPDVGRLRDCISDEHYIPTLMAVHGLEDEMDCQSWGISSLDWSKGGAHPKSYDDPREITPELIYSLRGGAGKEQNAAQVTAQKQFWSCDRVPRTLQECNLVPKPPEFEAISGGPMLLARKFPAGAADAVYDLIKQCSSLGFGLLSGRPCS